ISRPPFSLLFPYTTLFRSLSFQQCGQRAVCLARRLEQQDLRKPWPGPRVHGWALFLLVDIVVRCAGGVRLSKSSGISRRAPARRSEEHTSELQSLAYLVCR